MLPNLYLENIPLKMRHTKKLITLAGIAAFVTYWFYPPTYPVYPKSDHYDPDTQTFYNAEPQRAPINVASALGNDIL